MPEQPHHGGTALAIIYGPEFSVTDVRTCEACWKVPVAVARTPGTAGATRDLLCAPCAQGNYSPRVALFPPFGIYQLTNRKQKHG